ncbi:NAD(P)H-binding protein [Micromonospora zamorensis]|uniref:NAD(P)H-binding protein n=1 Tax=Micromonospora zamorensis TaxID=709883 RepID=UPI00386A150D|nr:NAD(P)H-binding protein [Micromonospora zamorensis]
MTILITGTNGTVSREVLRELAGAQPVRALVRDMSRTPRLDGVDYVVGDLDRPATLTPAFEGVTTLWLLTPMGPTAPSQSMNAVWAARQAGVRHIVRLSAIGAAHDAPTRNGRLHALSDAELQESGIPWTILRPSHFMQNLLGSKAGEHLYGLFGEARVGVIDARDIAATAAAILAAPERHEGRIYTPTGPESITLHQAADDIARTLGQPVRYVPQSPEKARDNLLRAGLDQWTAEVLAEYRVAYGSGWGDFTNDHVENVVGRAPRSFAEFANDHREQFATA